MHTHPGGSIEIKYNRLRRRPARKWTKDIRGWMHEHVGGTLHPNSKGQTTMGENGSLRDLRPSALPPRTPLAELTALTQTPYTGFWGQEVGKGDWKGLGIER